MIRNTDILKMKHIKQMYSCLDNYCDPLPFISLVKCVSKWNCFNYFISYIENFIPFDYLKEVIFPPTYCKMCKPIVANFYNIWSLVDRCPIGNHNISFFHINVKERIDTHIRHLNTNCYCQLSEFQLRKKNTEKKIITRINK